MTRRDPDPFQAGLIDLLRDASVGHLALAAAADLLAAEHRMSHRFTEREIHGDPARAHDERPFELWEQTAPVYLACLRALERFARDRSEAPLIETLESAARIFAQACAPSVLEQGFH